VAYPQFRGPDTEQIKKNVAAQTVTGFIVPLHLHAARAGDLFGRFCGFSWMVERSGVRLVAGSPCCISINLIANMIFAR